MNKYLIILILAFLPNASNADTVKAKTLTLQEQDNLVNKAHRLLDNYSGQRELLIKANNALSQVLSSNPKHVRAHIEMARFYLDDGFVSYEVFNHLSLDKADQELKLALQFDSNSADAYILQGYIQNIRQSPENALGLFQKAESIGTTNPWLLLNWASSLMKLEKWDLAEKKLNKLQITYANDKQTPPDKLANLKASFISIYFHQKKMNKVDKNYKDMIVLEPMNAWNHGNYAHFLLFTMGNADAAITEARNAIALLDYGIARQTLACAQLAKWSQLKKSNSTLAMQFYEEAMKNELSRSFVMNNIGFNVGDSTLCRRLMKDLMTQGIPIDTPDEHGDTALTLSAYQGNNKSAEWLLQHGANINLAEENNFTPLHLAVIKGYPEMVKLLNRHGANVNAKGQYGRSVLWYAVTSDSSKNAEMVKSLLAYKADVNLAAEGGDTPLMQAAGNGNKRIVDLLLNAGADPEVRMQNHQDAADVADFNNHKDMGIYIRQYVSKKNNRNIAKKT